MTRIIQRVLSILLLGIFVLEVGTEGSSGQSKSEISEAEIAILSLPPPPEAAPLQQDAQETQQARVRSSGSRAQDDSNVTPGVEYVIDEKSKNANPPPGVQSGTRPPTTSRPNNQQQVSKDKTAAGTIRNKEDGSQQAIFLDFRALQRQVQSPRPPAGRRRVPLVFVGNSSASTFPFFDDFTTLAPVGQQSQTTRFPQLDPRPINRFVLPGPQQALSNRRQSGQQGQPAPTRIPPPPPIPLARQQDSTFRSQPPPVPQIQQNQGRNNLIQSNQRQRSSNPVSQINNPPRQFVSLGQSPQPRFPPLASLPSPSPQPRFTPATLPPPPSPQPRFNSPPSPQPQFNPSQSRFNPPPSPQPQFNSPQSRFNPPPSPQPQFNPPPSPQSRFNPPPSPQPRFNPPSSPQPRFPPLASLPPPPPLPQRQQRQSQERFQSPPISQITFRQTTPPSVFRTSASTPAQSTTTRRQGTGGGRLTSGKVPGNPSIPGNFGFLSGGRTFGPQNVPGRAGADYPVYSEIPFTNFDCHDHEHPGFYADVEAGCQVYHNCDIQRRKHTFMCSNGTIFSQEFMICDWWYNVKCDDSSDFYKLNAHLYTDPPPKAKKKNSDDNDDQA